MVSGASQNEGIVSQKIYGFVVKNEVWVMLGLVLELLKNVFDFARSTMTTKMGTGAAAPLH